MNQVKALCSMKKNDQILAIYIHGSNRYKNELLHIYISKNYFHQGISSFIKDNY